VYGIIGIFKGTLSLVVLDIQIPLFGDTVKIEVLSIDNIRSIIGGVIDDHCHVIGVILSEDRIEVVFNAHKGVVIVRSHHCTDRKLLLVCR
jgi:hypothetical protein